MRHKYSTGAMVLARTPLSEAGMLITLLTPEFGLIRARAEGVRRAGAKLAHALQTWCEADIMLVRGKEGWRLTGALLEHDSFRTLGRNGRKRAARVAGLLVRLVHGEASEPALYALFTEFVRALPNLSEDDQDAAESLVALRLLTTLGFDAGELPRLGYGENALGYVRTERKDIISRINRGIAAAGVQ